MVIEKFFINANITSKRFNIHFPYGNTVVIISSGNSPTEAVPQRCCMKKVFWKVLQNLQWNICVYSLQFIIPF